MSISRSTKCLQLTYSLDEWQRDLDALRANSDPPPCPCCSRRGFYEPKWAEPNRHYRACKFCGFFQNVDDAPYDVIRYECRDPNHDVVADWKVPTETWTCTLCGRLYLPVQHVPWPADDPLHPWNQVPISGSQDEYRRFWNHHGSQVGPFGIP